MNANKAIVTYQRLRDRPLWKLLVARNAPIIIALLQTYLLEETRSVSASLLFERLGRDLEELRARGEDFPQTAQAYVADWLTSGYLTRRFPAGAAEEEYELTADAAGALRFIAGLVERRTVATESRLSTVIQQLVHLAEETEADPVTRIAALEAERDRIDREIDAVRQGRLKPLDDDRALERIREVIALAADLAGDFRRVRDEFEQLNHSLREQIIDRDSSRGEVLDALFAGVDVIAASDAGRTFYAFWRLLMDPEQGAVFEEALGQVTSRDFASRLSPVERRFLLRLTRTLLEQGGMVHEVLQNFARSLKQFVQSREYLEQRRFNQLLTEAHRAALGLKDQVKAGDTLHYDLQLTSSRLKSIAQWALYDPSQNVVEGGMAMGEAPMIGLETIGGMVAQSEIDFRTLKDNISLVLAERSQASIGDVIAQFPATQGLGSIVGYVALGSRHGLRMPDQSETVCWQGEDEQWRWARIPCLVFLQEKARELV
jgi:Protein of unknown function (DUF3375)